MDEVEGDRGVQILRVAGDPFRRRSNVVGAPADVVETGVGVGVRAGAGGIKATVLHQLGAKEGLSAAVMRRGLARLAGAIRTTADGLAGREAPRRRGRQRPGRGTRPRPGR